MICAHLLRQRDSRLFFETLDSESRDFPAITVRSSAKRRPPFASPPLPLPIAAADDSPVCAQTIASPLAVDGDVTVSGARVEFLNFTNIVTDTWQPFLTATGTATGDFASDNLFGAYRRKKDGSSYAMAHLTGIMIIFR